MELLGPDQIETYTDIFYTDPEAFAPFGVREILFLTPIVIRWDLMTHMQSRWDPLRRAYRIGDIWMCPTLEDFGGILMSPYPRLMVLPAPTHPETSRSLLQSHFALGEEDSSRIVQDHSLDLQVWHQIFVRDRDGMSIQSIRLTALSMLLAQFFTEAFLLTRGIPPHARDLHVLRVLGS